MCAMISAAGSPSPFRAFGVSMTWQYPWTTEARYKALSNILVSARTFIFDGDRQMRKVAGPVLGQRKPCSEPNVNINRRQCAVSIASGRESHLQNGVASRFPTSTSMLVPCILSSPSFIYRNERSSQSRRKKLTIRYNNIVPNLLASVTVFF
jgi:hypothetical protein